MVIHIIGTVNGQINEGMRNIATHLSKEFEKENEVLYSGLKQLAKLVYNSKKADITIIFARANGLVYDLTKIVTKLCKNTWIVLVQEPEPSFVNKNNKNPLDCSYLSITNNDLRNIKIIGENKKELFNVGIKASKFLPVDQIKQKELKCKYGLDPERPLIVHVGHCSKGRGLEDFVNIRTAQRLVVASGLFENEQVVESLKEAGVCLHTGYLENIEEIYQMADVYLFPTKSTEFVISIPLSVMEALATGVPVIGYSSFKNLREIKSEKNAMMLIDNVNDIDKVLPELVKMKATKSLLKDTEEWSSVALKVLEIVKEK